MHRLEAYFRLASLFVVGISILYLPILLILKKRGKSILRQFSYIGLFSSVFLIIFATILFVPITFHPESHILNIVPFHWTESTDSLQQFVVEKLPNILLFIPLGFFIPVVFKKNRKFYQTILISFALTFSIEFFQYFIGRSSDIDDILTNLFGSIIGHIVFKLCNSIFVCKKHWKNFMGAEE